MSLEVIFNWALLDLCITTDEDVKRSKEGWGSTWSYWRSKTGFLRSNQTSYKSSLGRSSGRNFWNFFWRNFKKWRSDQDQRWGRRYPFVSLSISLIELNLKKISWRFVFEMWCFVSDKRFLNDVGSRRCEKDEETHMHEWRVFWRFWSIKSWSSWWKENKVW